MSDLARLASKLRMRAKMQALVSTQTEGVVRHDSLVCAFVFDTIAGEIESLLKSGEDADVIPIKKAIVDGGMVSETAREVWIARDILRRKNHHILNCPNKLPFLDCPLCNPTF